MTIPLICLAVAVLLPYIWSPLSLSERRSRFGHVDFKTPRLQTAQLSERGARAMGAHANAFEALTVFGAAVVVAHLTGANETASAGLAVVWVVARIAHGLFYVWDVRLARTGSFAVGLLCSLGLLGLAMGA